MHPPNSSTSSSDNPPLRRKRDILKAVVWTLLFLALIDAAVDVIFRYPDGGRTAPPNFLTRYFEYGRSIEGKLTRMVGPTDATTNEVALAGWLDPETWADQPEAPQGPDGVLVAIYGMSFAFHVGDALHELDPRYSLRRIGAPSAPASHSYAAFTLDRTRNHAQVVILGVLASSVRGMTGLTGQTWAFESPYPYTYPQYRVAADGSLQSTWSLINSIGDLRAALSNPERWASFVQQLREDDSYYDPFLFHHNLLDVPVTVRLIRRGWAQHHNQMIVDSIHQRGGFNPDSPVIPVLRALVTRFVDDARSDGRLPIVLLLNDQGYSDHLFKILEPTLKEGTIPYVSTHSIAPADDLTNFVSDGHFTHPAYQKIAGAVDALIRKDLTR